MEEALEIYIHVPFCVRKCAYCDFYSHPADRASRDAYFDMLSEEISLSPYTGRGVSSVFFGGGTPSAVEAEEIRRIMDQLKREFKLLPGAEVSIEVNPGTVTKEKLSAYREAGFNRLSLGLQSADDKMLEKLGRIHDFRTFSDTFHAARDAGFTNISLDLISGLPGQTPEGFEESLKKALSFQPEHLSVYSLIIEENTPFYRLYGPEGTEAYDLPDEDSERETAHLTDRLLLAAGYEKYEISNYARPGFQCRHNLGYWTGVPYLGFGAAAASYIDGKRFRNAMNDKYLELPYEECEVLTESDRMAEMMILGLRLTEGVRFDAFRERFGKDLKEVYGDVLRKYASLGALEIEKDRVRLTAYGMDTANIVMAAFL